MVIALFIALAVFAPAFILALHIMRETPSVTIPHRSRHERYTANGTRRIQS